MKRSYLFLALFGVWCLASALWYFLSVKGVSTDPRIFNPHASFVSIVEIIVMLLVSCLLGFAIAWSMRGEVVQELLENEESMKEEVIHCRQESDDLKSQIDLWRDKHQQDLQSCQQKAHELSEAHEKSRQQVIESEAALAMARQEALLANSRLEQHETEVQSLRYKIRQLEFQHQEDDATLKRLKSELSDAQRVRHERAGSEHPFVRPIEPDQKDDLTKIKGIGPFIEKRLNMIGIYTYAQLGELTSEQIDRVGAAIEFFPQRILRDNWVGQAQALQSQA